MDFAPRATVVKGLSLWREKQTSCLEECPHLVVLFDSIVHLCFHQRDHFLSLYNQFSMSYTLHKLSTELASSPDGN